MARAMATRSMVRSLACGRHVRSFCTAPVRTTMDSQSNDYTGVLSALSHYFDALHHNDAKRMQEVWHE